MAVDVMRVRQFNNRLTTNKEKSAQIRAEANMINNDINQLCAELSKELGRTITPENAQAEYEAYVADLEAKLTAGEQILDRIEGNNAQVAQQPTGGVFNQPQVGQAAQQVQYQQQMQPQQPVQPQAQQVAQPQQAVPQNGGYNGFASMGQQQFAMPQFTVGNPQGNQQANNFGNNATGI